MSRDQDIYHKLNEAFAPDHLEVLNESHQHSGPGTETHYRVLIVSSHFEGLNRVQRQQRVYQILGSELQSGVHALAQQTLTPAEWSKTKNPISSPACASKPGLKG